MKQIRECLKMKTDLKKIRERLKLTQLDMCKSLNVHINTYRAWEYGGGNPSKENVEKINDFIAKNTVK